jgi:CRP-like cAMP-binding protein
MMKKEDYLARISIFSYFKKKDLQRLAKKSRYFSFNIGDVIIREGECDGRFFILISGKADVIKSYGTRKQRLLRTLPPIAILEKWSFSMIRFDRRPWLPGKT